MVVPSTIETPCGWLVRALLSCNVDLQQIEDFVGRNIDKDSLDEMILATENYRELFEWGAEVTQNPLLGLYIAEKTSAGDFGILTYLIENSQTIGQSVDNLVKYHRIFSVDTIYSCSIEGTEGALTCHPVSIGAVEPRQDVIFTIASMVATVRRLADPDWRPLRCSFTMPAPTEQSEMKRVFDCDLEYLAASNSMIFSVDDLDMPIPTADAVLLSILKQHADLILKSLESRDELVHRLRMLVASSLTDPSFGMERAAPALNMSVRKLHRELATRGTSFREVRDRVVHESARSALLDGGRSITEIAHRVGYSETSAFSRAFRRIEGVSPSTFRRKEKGSAALRTQPQP